jgi:transcriptional regulator with XRE-family HTH domain
MTALKQEREKLNITQEQLAEKSGVSVRTIQRIESGIEPKGYTLKSLAEALEINEDKLLKKQKVQGQINIDLLKLINFSSLPFTIIPPVNIFLPLLIMSLKKEFNPMTKQVVTVQIFWTISSIVIFMLSAFMKNWFSMSNKFNLIIMVLLVLSNIYIILRNAFEIDKKGKLFFYLNFSII